MRLAVTIIAIGVLLGCSPSQPPLTIDNAWIRQAPPGVAVNAGYFTIRNQSAEALTITSVRSTAFARIEMHETSMQAGRMAMRKLDNLRVAPGEQVILEPGGKHLMLFDPLEQPMSDQKVPITLFDGTRPVAELLLTVARENPYE